MSNTPALDKLYAYLLKFNEIYGSLPTQKEIAADLGKDRSVVSKQMSKLVEQGKVKARYNIVLYSLT